MDMTVAAIKVATAGVTAETRIRRVRAWRRGFACPVATSVERLSDSTRVGLGDDFVYGMDLGNELSEHIW